MGRKYLTLASALLLALCLNACGSRPGTVLLLPEAVKEKAVRC